MFSLNKILKEKWSSKGNDDERVREFQRKLYRKAKQEPKFRFYILYDKISLPYMLREAYRRCAINQGSPGIDGQSFSDIKRKGEEEFLEEIEKELKNETYKPQMVLRKYIPKANGKMRPLGIPTIKDRVVQMACKMVVEPIFEADFEESSYGYRPKRSAKDAVEKIKAHLTEGKTEIYDADLSAYFDTILHKELMYLVEQRISDKRIVKLLRMWLKTPVYEDGRPRGGKKNQKGTPQGGVISPLLANIYLHLLDKAIKRDGGIFKAIGVKIVRYADDFVLMTKKLENRGLEYLKGMLERMQLKINEEKSRIVYAEKESFDFLGFTFRYDKDIYGREKRYWNVIPSKKSEKKVRENIDICLKENGHKGPAELVQKLNYIIRGWINYFDIPKVSYPKKAKRNLRYYLMTKMYRYYQRKSQRKCKLYRRGAFGELVRKYGLINPCKMQTI
jgi:RNA-directed DNA polymerase